MPWLFRPEPSLLFLTSTLLPSFSHCLEGLHSSDSPGELFFHPLKLIWVPPSMCIFSCYLQAVLGPPLCSIACNTIYFFICNLLEGRKWVLGSFTSPIKNQPVQTKRRSVPLETEKITDFSKNVTLKSKACHVQCVSLAHDVTRHV